MTVVVHDYIEVLIIHIVWINCLLPGDKSHRRQISLSHSLLNADQTVPVGKKKIIYSSIGHYKNLIIIIIIIKINYY